MDHTIGAKVTQETNLTFDILIRGRFKNQYRTGLHKQLLAIRRIARGSLERQCLIFVDRHNTPLAPIRVIVVNPEIRERFVASPVDKG